MSERFREPSRDCSLCPRLADFREENRLRFPDYWNAPVPAFGALSAPLLIVGLAPGLHGANRSGRPFTGDFAGDLLYETLGRHGFAQGEYRRERGDGLQLIGCRITNAVRCVPPQNKPTGAETATCRSYLAQEQAAMPSLKAVLALGGLAHAAVLAANGIRPGQARFAHGAEHPLPYGQRLFDSYHCSRYNTNTGVLTPAMFERVLGRVAAYLCEGSEDTAPD